MSYPEPVDLVGRHKLPHSPIIESDSDRVRFLKALNLLKLQGWTVRISLKADIFAVPASELREASRRMPYGTAGFVAPITVTIADATGRNFRVTIDENGVQHPEPVLNGRSHYLN